MVKYVFLCGAILLEVMATLMLPLTQNFSKLLPTLALAGLYILSFYLLTFALKYISHYLLYMPLGAVWAYFLSPYFPMGFLVKYCVGKRWLD